MAGFQAMGAVPNGGGRGGAHLGTVLGAILVTFGHFFSCIFLGWSPGTSLMDFASMLGPFWDVFLTVVGRCF